MSEDLQFGIYIPYKRVGSPQVGSHLGLHCGFACPRWGTPRASPQPPGCFPRWGHRSYAQGVPHSPPCPGYRIHYIGKVPDTP